MKHGILYGCCLMFLSSFIFSCKKDLAESPADLQYDYFPLQAGSWIIYDVDSSAWDNINDSLMHFSYQLRERIDTAITDNSGETVWRMERHMRDNSSKPWQIKDVWVSRLTPFTAEKTEENNKIIKLVFPIKENKKWNANSYNMLEAQTYKYTNVHEALSIGGAKFDSTITVLQKEYSKNLVNEDYAYEVYAKHIGLVQKEFLYLYMNLIDTLEYVHYTYTYNSAGR